MADIDEYSTDYPTIIEAERRRSKEYAHDFGARMKLRREQVQISQQMLSVKTGISTTMISKWENGRGYPQIKTAITLCRALGCSLDWLLAGRGKISARW